MFRRTLTSSPVAALGELRIRIAHSYHQEPILDSQTHPETAGWGMTRRKISRADDMRGVAGAAVLAVVKDKNMTPRDSYLGSGNAVDFGALGWRLRAQGGLVQLPERLRSDSCFGLSIRVQTSCKRLST